MAPLELRGVLELVFCRSLLALIVAAGPPVEVESPEKLVTRHFGHTPRLDGWRWFRLGVSTRTGALVGWSRRENLFDLETTTDKAIEKYRPYLPQYLDPTAPGRPNYVWSEDGPRPNPIIDAYSLGPRGGRRFGGMTYGLEIDAELLGLNFWIGARRLAQRGGTWSLLVGYDHEFALAERVRLDLGYGVGGMKLFGLAPFERLYYDKRRIRTIDFADAGLVMRARASVHLRIVGPVFIGGDATVGYHSLWSATQYSIDRDDGAHLALTGHLRLDYASPAPPARTVDQRRADRLARRDARETQREKAKAKAEAEAPEKDAEREAKRARRQKEREVRRFEKEQKKRHGGPFRGAPDR